MPTNRGPEPADIAGLSFEDALGELERIVKGLESGSQKLEEAISAYERSAASAIPFSWTVMPAGIFRLRQPAATAEPNRPPSMSATRTTRPLLFSKRRTDASSAA